MVLLPEQDGRLRIFYSYYSVSIIIALVDYSIEVKRSCCYSIRTVRSKVNLCTVKEQLRKVWTRACPTYRQRGKSEYHHLLEGPHIHQAKVLSPQKGWGSVYPRWCCPWISLGYPSPDPTTDCHTLPHFWHHSLSARHIPVRWGRPQLLTQRWRECHWVRCNSVLYSVHCSVL